MSDEARQSLIDRYYARAKSEGRLPEVQEKVEHLTSNFNKLMRQASKDQALLKIFMSLYEDEPQAIRMTNTIAWREGGQAIRDASQDEDFLNPEQPDLLHQ
ncbi:MAG: hypothetical protein LRZ85_09870 [Alphaproteobacteria bacterium]|nr:hypothetical protein [Alphaproteobacteria bacterium]MCD8525765.1 hypothetical protein [Alphaproteobacteria bacterium]MCD8571146.1 hypothetical protein [Alphaproteobacteria bacterium]